MQNEQINEQFSEDSKLGYRQLYELLDLGASPVTPQPVPDHLAVVAMAASANGLITLTAHDGYIGYIITHDGRVEHGKLKAIFEPEKPIVAPDDDKLFYELLSKGDIKSSPMDNPSILPEHLKDVAMYASGANWVDIIYTSSDGMFYFVTEAGVDKRKRLERKFNTLCEDKPVTRKAPHLRILYIHDGYHETLAVALSNLVGIEFDSPWDGDCSFTGLKARCSYDDTRTWKDVTAGYNIALKPTDTEDRFAIKSKDEGYPCLFRCKRTQSVYLAFDDYLGVEMLNFAGDFVGTLSNRMSFDRFTPEERIGSDYQLVVFKE